MLVVGRVDMLFIVCVTFFFFKQKTAYEMRISDWSSDVCSSDLTAPQRQPGQSGQLAAEALAAKRRREYSGAPVGAAMVAMQLPGPSRPWPLPQACLFSGS